MLYYAPKIKVYSLAFSFKIMSSVTRKSATESDPKHLFLDQLSRTQEWLDSQGVAYRIIGSVAADSYIDSPDGTILNFNEEDTGTLAERVPDIDLIVPRGRLAKVRQFRDSISKEVKLGLAIPTQFIDFRPDEATSFMTHNDRRFPVPTHVFDPVERQLFGEKIVTVNPATLVYTYYSLRERDRPRIAKLSEAAEEYQRDYETSELYSGMREFSGDWAEHKSWMDVTVQTTVKMLERLPPPARLRAMRIGLTFASLAKLR